MKNCKRIGLLIGLMSCFLAFGCKDDLRQNMPNLKKIQEIPYPKDEVKEGYTKIMVSGSAAMTPPKPKNGTRSAVKNENVKFSTRISEENQDYLIDWTKMKDDISADLGLRLAIAVVDKKTKKVVHVEYVYLSHPEIKRKNDNLTGDDVDRNGYYMHFSANEAQNDGAMPTTYLSDDYEYYASGYIYQANNLFYLLYETDSEGKTVNDPVTGKPVIIERYRQENLHRGDFLSKSGSYKSLDLNSAYVGLSYEGNRFSNTTKSANFPVTSTWTKISRGSYNHFDFNIFLKPRGTMMRFNVKNNLYSTVNFIAMTVKTNAFVPVAQFSQDIPVGENIADYEGKEISWKVPEEKELYLKANDGLYEFFVSGARLIIPAFGYDYYEAKNISYQENAPRNTSGYLYAWVMPTDAPGRIDDGIGKGGGKRTIKIKPLVFPTYLTDVPNITMKRSPYYNQDLKGLIINPEYKHLYYDMFLPKDETIIEHNGNGSNMWIKEAFNYSLRLKPIESDLMITQIVSADRSTKSFGTPTLPGDGILARGFNTSKDAKNYKLMDEVGSGNLIKKYNDNQIKDIVNKGLNLTMVTLYNPTNKTIDLREYGFIRAWFDPKTKRNKFFNGEKGGGDDMNDALVQIITTDGNSPTPRVSYSKGTVSNRRNLNRSIQNGSSANDLNLKPGQSIVICGGAFASYPWGLSPTNDIMFGNYGEEYLLNNNSNLSFDNQIKNNISDGSCLRAIAFDNAIVEQGWDRYLYNIFLERLFTDYTYIQKGFSSTHYPRNRRVTRPLFYYYATEGKDNNDQPVTFIPYVKYNKDSGKGPLYQEDAFKLITDYIPFEKAGVLSLRNMQGLVLMKKGEGGYKPLDACLVDLTLTSEELNKLGTKKSDGTYLDPLQYLGRLFYETAGGSDGELADCAPFCLYKHPGLIYPNLSFFKTPRFITSTESMNTESEVVKYKNVIKDRGLPFYLEEGTTLSSWYSPSISNSSSYDEELYSTNKNVFNDYWFGRRTGKSLHDAWMQLLKENNN